MINVIVDTRRLNAAMQDFARTTRKSLDSVVKGEAAIMVGQLIASTPPGDRKGDGATTSGTISNKAKKTGESRIAADIAMLFPTTKLPEEKVLGLVDAGFEFGTARGKKIVRQFAATEADLERIHKEARSPATGRVRTGSMGQLMAMTRAAVRRAYTKRAIQKVGILNAGWLNAARELKTNKKAVPAWITRHGAKPGGVVMSRVKEGLSIRVYNSVQYFPKDMDRRLQRIVDRRRHALRKAMEEMAERQAKRATKQMGN